MSFVPEIVTEYTSISLDRPHPPIFLVKHALGVTVEAERSFTADEQRIGAGGQPRAGDFAEVELLDNLARNGIDHGMVAARADSQDHLAIEEHRVGVVGEFLLVPQQRPVTRIQGDHVHAGLALDDQGFGSGHGQAGTAEAGRGNQAPARLLDQFADLGVGIGPDDVACGGA